MYRFVIWGCGVRGKRFLYKCPQGRIAAIIDSNKDLQGTSVEGIPVISYEDYREEYMEYDILITLSKWEEVCSMLMDDGIDRIHLFSNCPRELQCDLDGIRMENLPLEVEDERCVIYGLSVYSMLLRDFLEEKYGYRPDIIPEGRNRFSEAFARQYPYVKFREPSPDETILWTTCFMAVPVDKRQKILDFYDFKGQLAQYRTPELEQFRDIHLGERCFCIGNGPSLRISDLELLWDNDVDCFGCNMVYRAFNQTHWRPKYYVTGDNKIRDECIQEMWHYQATSTLFYVAPEDGYGEHQQNVFYVREHALTRQNGELLVKFAKDASSGIYLSTTVIYECLQLAAYMGYEEIYLLGVDLDRGTDHFIKNYLSPQQELNVNPPRLDEAKQGMEVAREYADSHGIKIYNATRGGKLEAFERVDFDSLWS